MRFIDLLKYSFIKTIRDKRKFYFIAILSVCSLLLLGVSNFYNGFFDSYHNFLLNDISERKIILFPTGLKFGDTLDSEIIEKIKEIDHVQDIYLFAYNENWNTVSSFKNDEYTGNIILAYGNEFLVPKLIKGDYFSRNDTGKAICPSNFYPSLIDKNSYFKNNTILKENDLYGKRFNIETDNYVWDNGPKKSGTLNKTFEIVGIYDSGEDYDGFRKCFVSLGDMKEIYEANTKYLNNPSYSSDESYIVLVDSPENVADVIKKINDVDRFNIDLMAEPDEETLTKISNTSTTLFILIVVAIVGISYLYMKKTIKENSYEIGVNKAMGFLDSQIICVDIVKTFIVTLFSLLIGVFIYIIVLVSANTCFEIPLLFSRLDKYFCFKIVSILTSVVITLLVPVIVVSILSSINLKKTSISLIGSDKE